MRRIVLVGSPNVGKSGIFNQLTGRYAVVSNYPGTTVEISRGEMMLEGELVEVVDTPGTYSLLPASEEEAVTRRLLWQEDADLVLHVVDTKNLEHSLSLTFALLEAGFRVILVLNMFDEAERFGFAVDVERLEERLGIPCAATIGTSGWGVEGLKEVVRKKLAVLHAEESAVGGGFAFPVQMGGKRRGRKLVKYPLQIERLLTAATGSMKGQYPFSARTAALLLLAGDEEVASLLHPRDRRSVENISKGIPPDQVILSVAAARRKAAQRLLEGIVRKPEAAGSGSVYRLLDSLTLNPLTGLPLLALIVYFLLYQFVGVFGAGILAEFLDREIFGKLFNPFVQHLVDRLVSSPTIRELLACDYGILTLGVRYAVAVVFPITATFFASLALLEDTGCLPRLAYLADRVFGIMGLSGRAVIPLIMGFGCGTTAVLVTRTLETKRERLIVSFVLALAVPCSAQLGVILSLLAGRPEALAVWAAAVGTVGITAGLLLARILPGSTPTFVMELPPLRWPPLSNVYKKTAARVSWYLSEIIPLFIWASVIIWLGRVTGALERLVAAAAPLMSRLGLPAEAARVFLYGFFRRDYGAAGLYDLQEELTVGQLTTAAVILTLFVPCVAQLAVIVKERGLWTALIIAGCTVFAALLAGFAVSRCLSLLGMM